MQTNRKIYNILGLEKSVLLKWPYYPRQSADSTQSLLSYHEIFHRTRTNDLKSVWKHNTA